MLSKIIKKCKDLKWLRYSDPVDIKDYSCSYSKHLARFSIYRNLPIVYALETRAQTKLVNRKKIESSAHHYFINLYLHK